MTSPDEEEPAHRVRALSFGSVAAEYAALRPGYPRDAVAFLAGARLRRVLDLGAGTGLLTEVLVAAGHDVVAVDPSPEMLDQLTARLPGVEAIAGGAEVLPLADGSVDVIVAGQAAHWFDPPAAAREMRRVLRPGGVVGLLWNLRDDRIAWVAELLARIPGRSLEDVHGPALDAFVRELRADVDTFESGIVQRMTPDDIARRTATSSRVVTMTPDRREAFLAEVLELLATHPDTRGKALLELPYRTLAQRLTPR
jgi:SAM-dependent methyltransferase